MHPEFQKLSPLGRICLVHAVGNPAGYMITFLHESQLVNFSLRAACCKARKKKGESLGPCFSEKGAHISKVPTFRNTNFHDFFGVFKIPQNLPGLENALPLFQGFQLKW